MTPYLASQQNGRSRLALKLYSVFIFLLALDFKSESGGVYIQFILAFACLSVAGFLIVVGFPQSLRQPYGWVVAAFLVYALAVATLRGDNMGNFVRVAFPFLLFAVTIFTVSSAFAVGVPPEAVTRITIYGCLISIVWRYVYATVFVGLSTEEMRYQILSPAAPFLFAWVFANFAVGRRITASVLISAIFAVVPVILSITRSYLFTFALVPVTASGVFFYLYSKKVIADRSVIRFFAMLFGFLVLLSLAFFIASRVRTGVFDVWTERLFYQKSSSGTDITYLTRAAESSGIWSSVTTSVDHFIFGFGMGATYYWDRAYLEMLGGAVPVDYFDEGVWFSGHSQWTYLLFSCGAIGTICFCVFVIQFSVRSFRVIRINAERKIETGVFIGTFALLSHVAMLSQSFTSAPFGDRITGAFFGILVALIYYRAPNFERGPDNL